LAATGSLTAGGTLTVTNVGALLQAGDSFQLFNQPVNGFAAVEFPPLEAGLIWTNKLSLDGSLQVIAPVSTVPPDLSLVTSGTDLVLSWPVDHIGWRLQTQTASSTDGLGTNWIDVADSSSTNEISVPIDLTDESVFFRLIYP
jgi:hypothetical protein